VRGSMVKKSKERPENQFCLNCVFLFGSKSKPSCFKKKIAISKKFVVSLNTCADYYKKNSNMRITKDKKHIVESENLFCEEAL
jgi:hypothetical protein